MTSSTVAVRVSLTVCLTVVGWVFGVLTIIVRVTVLFKSSLATPLGYFFPGLSGKVSAGVFGSFGCTVVVACSTLTVTVGMPSAPATTVDGTSWLGTCFQPAGICGVTVMASPVVPVSGVLPTSLPFGSTELILPVC